MASAYYGSKGGKVLRAQKALNARGAALKEDGIWGDKTEQAYLKASGGLAELTLGGRGAANQAQRAPEQPPLKPIEYRARDETQLSALAQALGAGYDQRLEDLQRGARDQQQRYEAQIEGLDPAYEKALAELEAAYAKNKQGVSDAALSRGMGRSSYVTDQLAGLSQSELGAMDSARSERMKREGELSSLIAQLMGDTDQSAARLKRERAEAIASSIESMRQEDVKRGQEALMYNNQLSQAQIDSERERDKLALQQAQFEAEQQRLSQEAERQRKQAAKKNKLDWYKAKHKPR